MNAMQNQRISADVQRFPYCSLDGSGLKGAFTSYVPTWYRKHRSNGEQNPHTEVMKIHITVSTTAGDLEDDFPANEPLHALKRGVMGRLKLDPSTADQFVLTFNGTALDESQTLRMLNIPANAVLVLERKEVVKI